MNTKQNIGFGNIGAREDFHFITDIRINTVIGLRKQEVVALINGNYLINA